MFGGEKGFDQIKRRDAIKNKFAKDNGFILIRIPYYEKCIENTLRGKIEKVIGIPLDQLKRIPDAHKNHGKIKFLDPRKWKQLRLVV